MDVTNESDKQPATKNGPDFEILRKDEAFWASKVKSLAKEQISETIDDSAENDNKSLSRHPETVFSVHCKCSDCECLTFRKLIMGIVAENTAYNDLWEKAKEIISLYYTLLPKEQESVINQKYQELLKDSCGIRWFSDGSIDVKKNVHVSMGNYFSLSNEMTFIIVFNSLILRDRHQLFELLCLQLTSIILAYREGIKEMTRCVDGDQEYYKPEEFLNYILNGYDRLTEIADTLTPLVIEMRDHLQKFSLSWQLMNQCMYFRFLYVDIESRMADCILRLKDAVDPETYKSFVYRFIKFDEEMTQIGQVWDVALQAVESYRKSPEQLARVERIGLIRQITESLRGLKSVPDDAMVNEKALALDWLVSSEKEKVWMGVLNSIKIKAHYQEHKKHPCKCWSCQMAGGNTVPEICAIPDDSPLQMNELGDEYYHLAWAVFKHLNDREPYVKQFIHPELFCVFNDPPCELMECQVATNLIIGSYPLSFTKFLLRTYQPLSTIDREKFLKVPSQSLIRKFCLKKGGAAAKEIMQEADEINHSFLLLNMFWDDDDIADPMLRAGLAAALAENFKIDIKFPHKRIILSYFYALFRIGNCDIVMDLDWLEKINLANLFKGFGVQSLDYSITSSIHDSSSTLNNTSNTVEAIEMTLNELKITAEVSAGSNALDLVQFSMKEVADKLSSISLTDDNSESAKQVLENEIKKPLVEALKLAASNKKLEAELKSLQKEHNMLKDMVKGLEQIHGEKKEVQVTVTTTTTTKSVSTEGNVSKCGHTHGHHNHSQSGSSSPSTSDVDHGKDSGSGADCVCYYCTLFGKNQDLNSRSTETRDRLRKRLHHLQSQKDFSSKTKNLKNIGLLLKNGAATASATAATPKPAKCAEPTTNKCSSEGLPSSLAAVKMKVELELEKRKKERKVNVTKPAYANKPQDVKIQRATEINLKSLENLVEYIEGPTSKAVVEQKKAEEVAAKKQQKKAKQTELKIRRQIDLNLYALTKINIELQETITDAKQIQNQLSQLKAGKGKNKELKKVKSAEDKLSELTVKRVKMENEANGLLTSIKEMNPNIEIYQECYEMKSIMGLLAPPPENFRPKPAQIQAQQVPVQRPFQIKVQPTHPAPQQTQYKSDDDPSKRMVTIRRINLPHAEPQVTVTAKGTTPDMDQLLYTFVNGQMVPASSLSPSAFQNGSIQLFMSSNGQTKMVVENNLHLQQQHQKKVKHESPVTITPMHTQHSDKNKKRSVPVAPTVEKVQEKAKRDGKKKKEEVQPPVLAAKKELKKQHVDKKPEINVEKKMKRKKAYIDPEFAANPFKLLDDEEEQISESEESVLEIVENIPEAGTKLEDDSFKSVKKMKEDKKVSKNQIVAQQQPAKIEKVVQKKNQQQVKVKNERKDSVTSATSSNASKDSKASKKQQQAVQEITFKQPPPVSRPMLSPHPSQTNTNSIMDQLNRGVRVEGLRLPPGITLTKVAPSDAVGMKRESINRIAQPMQDVPPAAPRMPEMMAHGQSNGIIMVESNPHAQNTRANPSAESVNGKKKNKKKKAKTEAAENTANSQHQERMVTLKNPMFYNGPTEPVNSMMRNMQTPSPVEPHGASITRNENGMYTIRNPSFQNAFGAGAPSPGFAQQPLTEPVGRTYPSNQFSAFENDEPPMEPLQPKCSVIGSEMKTVLKRRQEQEFNSGMAKSSQYGIRQPSSSYSHFDGPGVNFSNNGTHCYDSYNMPQQSASKFQYPQPTNYDDLRLQPGQMLNHEVTVHDVTESKIFQNQAKKTPPPIGTPRNGNSETVTSLFKELIITRPLVPPERLNGNESLFMTPQSKCLDLDDDNENDTIKRFDFNHVPPKQPLKTDDSLAKKTAMSHAIGDDFAKRQNSTNSDSPISVTSLDEMFDKSSGASSLFSSGM